MLTSVLPPSCRPGVLVASPLICLLGLTGCITEVQPTEVVVEVRADQSVQRATKTLRIELWAADGDPDCSAARCWQRSVKKEVPATGQPWPVRFPVVPSDADHPRVFEIVVRALDAGGGFLVEARAVSRFMAGKSLTLELDLSRECQALGEACRGEADCHGSSCPVCRAGACSVTGVYPPAGDPVLPDAGALHADAQGAGLDAGADAMAERDADARADWHDARAPEAGPRGAGSEAGLPPVEVVCEKGSWNHDGDPFTDCVPRTVCAAGEYVTAEGDATSDRTCGGCPSGTYSTGASSPACTQWSVCLPGTFVANVPSTTQDRICEPCEEGRFTERPNQSACLLPGSCAAGSQQVTSGTDTSPPECEACDPGTFCEGGEAMPEACTGERWDHDADPATACVERTVCLAGQYVAAEGGATSDRACTSCASGAFSNAANAARCTPWRNCLAGSYVKNVPSAVEDRKCAECESGMFSGASNQASCGELGACEAGTRQVKSGTAASAPVCDACNRGVYCAGGTAPASVCDGTTWDHDADPSTPCAERTRCGAGKFVVSDGDGKSDRSCASCESGTFSTQDNAEQCDPWRTCEAGSYVTNTPSATQNRGCATCEGDTFTNVQNEAMCLPVGSCAAGTLQEMGGTSTAMPVCAPCQAGTYCAGGAAPLVACGGTTWDHDGDAATKCTLRTSCVAGEFEENTGSAVTDRVCATCEDGSFSTQDNAESCDPWMVCESGASETQPGSSTTDRICAEASWTRRVGNASQAYVGQAVDVDGEGNVLLAGYSLPEVPNGGRTWFVNRYDPAGVKDWTVQSDSEWESLAALRVADDGSVHVVIERKGESEFSDVLEWRLRKFDRAGTPKWTRSLSTQEGFRGMHALELDDAGNVYLQGTAEGELSGQTGPGDGGRFIRKYGPDGTVIWTWQFGGAAVGNDFMSVDAAGHVFLAGATEGVGQLGGPLYVCQLGDTAASVWLRLFGGEDDGIDAIQSMTVDDQGNVFVSGLTGVGMPGQQSTSGRFVFVSKVSAEKVEWTQKFAADTLTSSVSASADGRVYVAAGGLGEAHFDLSFVREYAADGSEGWTRQVGKMFYMYGLHIQAGAGGRAYAAGATYQMGDSTEDAFVSKLVP